MVKSLWLIPAEKERALSISSPFQRLIPSLPGKSFLMSNLHPSSISLNSP